VAGDKPTWWRCSSCGKELRRRHGACVERVSAHRACTRGLYKFRPSTVQEWCDEVHATRAYADRLSSRSLSLSQIRKQRAWR
jgi:hypothetical protein